MPNTGEFDPGTPDNPFIPVEQWEGLEGAFIHYGNGVRTAAFIWVDGDMAYFVMPDYAFPEAGTGRWSRSRPISDITGVTAWNGTGPKGTRAEYLLRFKTEYLPRHGLTFAQERQKLSGVFEGMKAYEAKCLARRQAAARAAALTA